jgi:hypothetical protein
MAPIMVSRAQVPIEHPVVDRFVEVRRLDTLTLVQVGGGGRGVNGLIIGAD